MSISVRDLTDQPHLRLEVLAGLAGLDRSVTWAHSSDLPEPWDWLSGGELLMKNGRTLPRSAAGQARLVEGLARAGAAALIIGTDPETPVVAARVIALADRLGLPVLRVPYSVSFIVLSRTVADALIHEESRRLARASRIYATIRDGIAAGDPAMFLARLEAEVGCELFVIDSGTGASVLDGTPPPPAPVRDELLAILSRRGGAVPGLLRADAGDGQAVAVEIPYDEPTLLVARRPGTDGQPFDMALLQHAATAAAVEVAHASLRQDHHRQLGTELLAQLLDARLDAAAAGRQLAARGLDPAGARLLAARGPAADDQRRLHVGLHRRHVDHLLIRRGGVFVVLLGQADTAGGHVALVRERLGADSVVGVSSLLGDALRVPEAAREAMWALAVAAERADRVAYYGGAAPLPALRDPAEAQALIDRALGSLLDYDRRTNSELLRSLAAFLDCRRSWQRTAQRLSVHRQTVVYRMERVEQITGRTLTETADLAELWLALSAYELLTGVPLLADGPPAVEEA
ncbi:MAG TPA: PucR family transcriptional regulator ligand-binding domain-containing protein [Streptosporangiaceae bacterium]|nr:PucR family transcriptional regulator ligand-binding domain-containing protein [Streptosporangiaceae bacterium]